MSTITVLGPQQLRSSEAETWSLSEILSGRAISSQQAALECLNYSNGHVRLTFKNKKELQTGSRQMHETLHESDALGAVAFLLFFHGSIVSVSAV